MEKNDLSNVLILILVLIIGFGILSFVFGGGMMMGGMMGFGMLLPVIFIIFLIYALSDKDEPKYYPSPPQPREYAIETLDHRYASGDISREEYLRIRHDLGF